MWQNAPIATRYCAFPGPVVGEMKRNRHYRSVWKVVPNLAISNFSESSKTACFVNKPWFSSTLKSRDLVQLSRTIFSRKRSENCTNFKKNHRKTPKLSKNRCIENRVAIRSSFHINTVRLCAIDFLVSVSERRRPPHDFCQFVKNIREK